MLAGPITGIVLHDVSGDLKGISIRVGERMTSICQQAPSSSITSTEIEIEVDAPIIGFDYSYDER